MTVNPSMKGFQPKAFNSVSELRSSGWKKHMASEFLTPELHHLCWLIFIVPLLPFSPSAPPCPRPPQDSCSLALRFIFILPHCPPLHLTNAKESGPVKSVGILLPNSLLTGALATRHLGNTFQLL